jgi:hypothetical protein
VEIEVLIFPYFATLHTGYVYVLLNAVRQLNIYRNDRYVGLAIAKRNVPQAEFNLAVILKIR